MVTRGGGFKLVYEQDTAAEHIGTAYQNRIVVSPSDGPHGRRLVVTIHGSNGDAHSPFMLEPDNNPNDRAQQTTLRPDFHTGFARSGLHLVSHDFWAINPATGAMDDAQFASAKVMALIDSIRTQLAPKLGCRSDKIILIGESQGSMDCMFYTLQWPDRVAACILVFPGGDIEGDRLANNQASINGNWGRPLTQVPQLALWNPARADGSGGQLLTLKNWATGTVFAVNDYVLDPAAVDNGLGSVAHRVVVAHTAGATFTPHDGKWAPIDPLGVHFAVPGESGLTVNSAKASLAFDATSPLAGKAASLSDPANLTRFQQITSGTLPGLWEPVPIYAYASRGDQITNMLGYINGVPDGFPFLAANGGFQLTYTSDVLNHAGGQGAPQPIDPQWATTGTLGSTGATQEILPGANGEILVQLTSSGTVAVIFEQTSDNGASWQPATVHSSVGVSASTLPPVTEGSAIATGVVSAAGFWRVNAIPSTVQKIRVRRTGGSSVTVYGGPVYRGSEQFATWPWQEIYDRALAVA